MRTFTVGGLRFVQIGQFSASFCFTQTREPFWTADRAQFTLVTIAMFAWLTLQYSAH